MKPNTQSSVNTFVPPRVEDTLKNPVIIPPDDDPDTETQKVRPRQTTQISVRTPVYIIQVAFQQLTDTHFKYVDPFIPAKF